jgi:hypothetical protein
MRLMLYGIVNFLAVASMIVWSGVMLGDSAYIASFAEPDIVASRSGVAWLQWLLAVALVLLVSVGLARSYRGPRDGSWPRPVVTLLYLLYAIVVCALAAPLAARVRESSVLKSPRWVISNSAWIGIGLAALVVITALLNAAAQRVRVGATPLSIASQLGIGVLTLRVLQAAFLLGCAWSLAAFFPLVDNETLFGPIFFSVLLAPVILPYILDRASPHHAYRDALMRCFGIYRPNASEVALVPSIVQTRLCDLEPRTDAHGSTFPELLICAAANVTDVGATPARSNVLSIVFSPSLVSIPAVPEASMGTEEFSRFVRPASLRNWHTWCPAVTLPSAIAMTGAAIAPAMGRKTRNDVRALFTALNIRLGVWIPNLLIGTSERPLPTNSGTGVLQTSPRRVIDALSRRRQTDFEMTDDIRVSVGMDELVRELFGYHSKAAPLLYVSDGGHYENLGLIELLRRRCSEIWCVDASGDRPGRSTTLAAAMQLASSELGCQIELDLERFERVDSSSRQPRSKLLRETHAVGTIRYANGDEGTIVVVKIGLTPDSPDELLEYQRTDPGFPHHPTFNQLFKSERFDAYRQLGWASMNAALRDSQVVARVSNPDETSEASPTTTNRTLRPLRR